MSAGYQLSSVRVHSHGLLSTGDTVATTTNPPFIRPDPPIPAIARPTISIIELWEIPQTRDPPSNIERKTKKVIYHAHISIKTYDVLER